MKIYIISINKKILIGASSSFKTAKQAALSSYKKNCFLIHSFTYLSIFFFFNFGYESVSPPPLGLKYGEGATSITKK